MRSYFTSESVTDGHPDKMCDSISDSVLDACLAQDPESRVAVETLVTADFCCIAGEITTKAQINIEEIARDRIREIGYTDKELGFSDKSKVLVLVHKQSPDISRGITGADSEFKEQGAGDQGLMFGFACRETPELMPLPIMLAHALARKLAEARRAGKIPEALPDGKSQVTVEYEGRVPKRIDTVVIAIHHSRCDIEELRESVFSKVIRPVLGSLIDQKTRILINATGNFELGGPAADTGVTGRKIIVDTYGGRGRHGGGAFSGKDPSKVDRSAAYAARYVAKNVVAAGLADECEVQVSYCIGFPEPLNIRVECFGSNKVPNEMIELLIARNFPLKPAAIIEAFGLKRPLYKATSAYGHFGRSEFPWEKTDKAAALMAQAEALIDKSKLQL